MDSASEPQVATGKLIPGAPGVETWTGTLERSRASPSPAARQDREDDGELPATDSSGNLVKAAFTVTLPRGR